MPDLTPGERFNQRLREIVQSTQSSVPEAQRLEKLLREFRELYPRPSFLGRLAEWFAHPHRVPAPAIAFAVVLLAVQGVALMGLQPKLAEQEIYRGVTVKCDDGPRIQVNFKIQARHEEVLLLLRQLGLTVTAGPNETGEFLLSIPKGSDIDEKIAMLKDSKIVEKAIKDSSPRKDCPK
jgi:hypothetical protein